jgi:hypothetical protein
VGTGKGLGAGVGVAVGVGFGVAVCQVGVSAVRQICKGNDGAA